jgi:hypothetical protein
MYDGHGNGYYHNSLVQNVEKHKPYVMDPKELSKPNFYWQPGASQIPDSLFPSYNPQPKLPFLETLHLLDLTRLLNDPICHNLSWPPMLTKLPSDIPKFKAKPNEDLGDHVTTFHLWCSSNSLKYDSVQLCLFQRTLIRNAVKWYIELNCSRYSSFVELAMAFLNHFQLPVRYDAGIELLANFK